MELTSIKKRDIIKYIISNGFIKQKDYNDCVKTELPRTYWVEVRSRSKMWWTHIFVNNKTNESLEFNRYYIELRTKNTHYWFKLNIINTKHIFALVERFLRK